MDFFFYPRSVAVVGASPDFRRTGGRPLQLLKEYGYQGKVYPINPHYAEAAGWPCYSDLYQVPGEIEVAILAVPAGAIWEVLPACAQKGVKGAIVFAGGFAETGTEGKKAQERISAFARETGIRIVGPNSAGIANLTNSAFLTFSEANFPKYNLGGLGFPPFFSFITQSGGVANMTVEMAREEGIGYHSMVSTGNEADLEFSDFLAYLATVPEVKVIGGYLEEIRNPAKFKEAAAKASAAGKPLLFMKAGRFQKGAEAAVSHTGALAGKDHIYSAFFKQQRIVRVENIEDFTAYANPFAAGRFPQGKRVGILSVTGGAAVLLTDECEKTGLIVPDLTAETEEKLRALLPPYASSRNPVDLTAYYRTNPGVLKACAEFLFADPQIDLGLLCVVLPEHLASLFAQELFEIYHSTSKPLVMVVRSPSGGEAEKACRRLRQQGLPLVKEMGTGARALAALTEYATWQQSG